MRMDMGIRGRVALVTGASSGLGEAVALALAREGARVALAARRRERLEAVAAQAKQYGAADARAFVTDLSEGGSGQRLLDRVRSELGEAEILILNGGGPQPGTFMQIDLGAWDRAYATMLRSMVELAKSAVPAMRARGWGRIVALTSSSVKQPIPTLVLSNALRIALVSALKSLSIEVAKDGVTVNSIATGRILTDRLRELYADERAMTEAAKRDIPVGRVATPDEFAPMTVFLCSDAAGYVTGQTIAVDGGLIASLT
jgi:3-oxoacyl-[acyl-carrier protein] reductase